MKKEQALNIAIGCVMASHLDSETKQAVIKTLRSSAEERK